MKKDEIGNEENRREDLTPDDGYYLDGDYDGDDAGLSEGEAWDEDWDEPVSQKALKEKRAWQEQEEAREKPLEGRDGVSGRGQGSRRREGKGPGRDTAAGYGGSGQGRGGYAGQSCCGAGYPACPGA